MKRSMTLLFVSLLLVGSVTACGGRDNQSADNDAANPPTAETGDPVLGGDAQSGANNGGSSNSAGGSGNSAADGGTVGEDLQNFGENAMQGAEDIGNAVDDAVTGGVSFDQMLRNARVHDKDGDLKDGENSTTSGVKF